MLQKSLFIVWFLFVSALSGFSATFFSQNTGDFSTLSNWNTDPGGAGSSPIASDLTDGTNIFIIQDGHTVTLDQDIDIAGLTVGQGTSGILTIGNDATARSLIVQGAVLVDAGATFNVGSFTATHSMSLQGDLTNNGTIDFFNSFTQLVSLSLAGPINLGGANTPQLGNIIFASGTSTAAVALDIEASVTIETASVFSDGNLTHNVAGDWTENGSGQMTGSGTIIFDASITQQVTTASTFNNVTFSGGATSLVTLAGTLTVLGDITINNNTRVLTATNQVSRADFTLEAGSEFTATNGTFSFNGSVTQNIDLSGTIEFDNVDFDNGTAANPKIITGNYRADDRTRIFNDAVVNDFGGDHTMEQLQLDGQLNFSGTITFTNNTITNNVGNSLTLGTADIIIDGGNINLNGDDNVIVNGDLTVVDGLLTVGANATLTGTGGAALTVQTGNTIRMFGADNFPTGFGTYSFEGTTSRALYDFSGNQVVRGGITYAELELGGGGTKTADGNLDIDGNLDLNTGVTLDLGSFSHTLTLNILNLTNSTIASSPGGSFTFDGIANAQTVQTAGTGSYTFVNFTIDNTLNTTTRTFNLDGIITTQDFNASTGIAVLNVDIDDNLILGNGTGTFTLGSNVFILASGASNFAVTGILFATFNLDANSVVRFDGANQDVPGIQYGNLQLAGNGTKTIQGPMDINGSLSRFSGTPLLNDGGFSHTLAGNWLLGLANTPAANQTGTFTFDGADQTIAASNFNNVIFAGTDTKSLNGDIDLSGDLTINDGSTLSTSIRDIDLEGNWDDSGTGTFIQSTGFVQFDGTTANQTIASNSNSSFGEVRIIKTNNSFETVTALTDFTIDRDLEFDASDATLDLNGQTVFVGRNWEFNTGTTFIANGGTVHFNGDVQQDILNFAGATTTYFNVTFSGAGEKNLSQQGMDIDGDVFIDGSTFNAGSFFLDVAGDWTNTGSFEHNNTVTLDGADQNISSSTFHDFTAAGTGTKLLTGNISVDGRFEISTGSTLDVGVANNFITVEESWLNDGTFVERSGTVTFIGGGNTITTGATGPTVGKRFYNLIVNSDLARKTFSGDIDVENDLTIQTGILRTNAFDVFVGGSLINTGTIEHNNNGSTLTFDATGGSHTFTAGGSQIRNIIFDAAGASYELGSNLTQNAGGGRSLILTNGTVETNGFDITNLGNDGVIDVNAGTFNIESGSTITMGARGVINNNGGIFMLVGDAVSPAVITSNQTNDNNLLQITQTAGTFHARNYIAERLRVNGIEIQGGTIDATNNFSDGTFALGASNGNAYLTLTGIDFGAGITVDNVIFNSGPSFNCSRTSGNGTVTFTNSSGTLAGEAFDEDDADPGTLIEFSFPGGFYWDGGGDGVSWNDPINWSSNTLPNATTNVFLEHSIGGVTSAYTVSITAADAQTLRLTLDSEGGNPIGLLLNGQNLTINENIQIGLNTILTQSTATDLINVVGNWTNEGTFNEGTSTVAFIGTSGTSQISTRGVGDPFYNLQFNAPGATYTLQNDIDINNDFILDDGIFTVSASQRIFVAGDWSMNGGTFNPGTGEVIFDRGGTGTQNIDGTTFYNFRTDNSTGTGTATKLISGSLTINDDVVIGSNTVLDGNTGIHRITDNWTNNAGSTGFSQSAGGAVAFIGAGQTIAGLTTTFGDVFFQGSNTKIIAVDIVIEGNVNIVNPVTVDINDGISITGSGGANSLNMSGGVLRLEGTAPNPTNFPSGFETINLSGGVVDYISDGAQDIFPTTYFDLRVRRLTAGSLNTKTLTGDITIEDDLLVNDVETELDVNGFTITLADDIGFPTGGRQIAWNGGTLLHNGTAGFNIDPDITGFNNLIFTGSGDKFMNGNLTITGDVTVQSGIRFEMNAFTMTSDGTGVFTLTANARIDSDIPASTGPAFPTNFSSYSLDQSSETFLRQNTDKTIYTNGGTITYGELNIAGDGTVTPDGNLDVDGDFQLIDNDLFLADGGFDINVSGANVDMRNYTATTNTFTFDGDDQSILFLNGDVNPDIITFNNIVFTGTGSKPFTSGDDLMIVNGDLTIEAGIEVTANIDFQIRGNWTNNGTFNHTTGFFTFDGTGAQTIDPGADHSFDAITFSNGGANAKTIVNNGFDINDNMVIDAGATVDFGVLTHNIAAANITNNGTWNTSSANLIFDRVGGQNIPAITALDVDLTEDGTKTMQGDWSVDNLTIANSVNLDANNTSNYTITLTGNWLNNGQFFDRAGLVAFESNNSDPKTIQTNGSDFNIVTFNQAQTSARTYTLANDTRIIGDLTLGSGATLNANSNAITFGNNDNPNVIEVLTIQAGASLEIDEAATLQLDCTDGNASVIVEGTLSIVGDASNSASVTRSAGGNRIDIDVTTGTIAARFYEFRFLVDEGLDIQSTATIDPTNNLSDGSWSEINTSAAADRRYLIIEADATGLPDISNVNFNHGTSPTLGRHFNVQRSAGAVGTITFAPSIGGLMGSEIYEDDGDGTKIEWPPATIATWTGAVDRDWHTAGNWNPMTVPDNTIEAVIPLTANQPIISLDDATCQTLTITDGSLIVDAGFDLTVITDAIIATGNSIGGMFVGDPTSEITIGGGWAVGPNGIFSANGGEVTFTAVTGSVNIVTQGNPFNDLVFSGSATFSITGNLDIDGDLIITSGSLSPASGGYNYTVAGDINNVGGTLVTTTNGTFTLDGADQTITNMTFDNLDVSGTGTKTMSGTVNIIDDLVVNSTMAGAAGSLIAMDGDVTINVGATFNDGGENHTFSGTDWTGLGGYIGSGTITFDGGEQDINGGFFNNLDLNGTGGVDIFEDVDVTGDVTVRNTINTLRNGTFLIDNTSGTGTFTLETNEQIFILGANNFPANFATYNIASGSTVRYEGLIDQTIAAVTYGNLRLLNPNTKTLAGNIEVQNDIDINTSTLDVSASNFRITLGDDFDNDDNTGGVFNARQGELVLNGTSTTDQQILLLGPAGTNDFYRVTVNKPAGAALARLSVNNIIVQEDLRVVSGEFSLNNLLATVSGNLLASGGTFSRNGTYLLDRPVGSASIQTNGSELFNIEINAGATYTLLDNLTVDGNYTLTSGTFDTNGQTAFLGDGNDVISITGTYIVSPGGTLELGNGASLIVNSGGEIQVVGTTSSLASVQSAGTGEYNFTVNGTIQASNYVFDGMGNNGIFINSGATIDATNNFSNGTFTNGDFGGTLLRIENTQDFTGVNAIMNVSFSDNPGGGAFNVTKSIAASGDIEFFDASGVFEGEDFDNDPNDLITWTGSAVITWDGSESSDWFDADNWTPAQVPTATDNVLIGSGANVPVINNTTLTAETNELEITNLGFLSINSTNGVLDLDINGALTLDGVVTMSSANDRMEVQGNWSRGATGTFTAGVGSTVAFTRSVGLQSINNGASPFYDVEINTGGVVQISDDLDANNNFTILAGEFDVTSLNHTLTVGGSFSNSGTFTARSGRVIFNSSAAVTNTIDIGSSAFSDVEINGNASATYQIVNNNATINGDLDVNNGAFDINGFTLTMGTVSNISVADEMEVDANSTINMGAGAAITVSSGGLLRILGTDASNVATITGTAAGRYSFVVSSGAELEARFYQLEFMNATGIQFTSGATINATNNLSDGVFSNGAPSGRYILLQNNFADFTTSNIVFNSGPLVNVRRVSGTGIATFEDASGLLSGPDFEDDNPDGDATTGFLRWDFTNPVLTWTGASDDNWHNALNWDDGMGGNSIPVSITNVFIPVTGFDPIISNADAVAANVNISGGATLTINTNRNLTISEDFSNAGMFTIANGSNTTVEVGGDWSNAGVFNNGGSSLVRLTADSGNNGITSGGFPFCGLEINSASPGTAVYSTFDPLDVDCDFIITDGTLEMGDPSHVFNIAGNWTVTAAGNFTNGDASVIFDGSGAQNLTQTSGDAFAALSIAGTGSVTLNTDIDVNGDLTISSTLTGGANNISVTGNWDKTGTFTPGTSVVTLDGNTQQQVDNTGGGNFFGLVINNTGSSFPQILMNDPVSVNDGGSFTLTDGIVETTSSALLTMGDNSTLNGGTTDASYVSGPMAKIGQQDFVFPVGKGTVFARIGVSGMTNSATMRAEYFDADFGNPFAEASIVRVSRIEYWDLTRTSGTGEPFVTLFWEDGTRSQVSDPSTLVVAHFESTQWLNVGNGATTGSATSGSIRSAFSISNFSPFTFASTDENNPLPITLTSFEGETIDGQNHLTWETSSEIDNDYFEIQRSFNGVDYEVIGEIKGNGTTEQVQNYSFVDKLPFLGNNFYRLRQVDFDGQSETINKVVVLNLESANNELSLFIYPNPTNQGDINTRIAGDQQTPMVIKMIDLYGKEVYSDVVTLSAIEGDYKIRVLDRLKQGIYIVTVQQAGKTIQSKLIVTE